MFILPLITVWLQVRVLPRVFRILEHDGMTQRRCAYRKSNPVILMVQSAQDWTADNVSRCFDGA
jgi:hypothetical protein